MTRRAGPVGRAASGKLDWESAWRAGGVNFDAFRHLPASTRRSGSAGAAQSFLGTPCAKKRPRIVRSVNSQMGFTLIIPRITHARHLGVEPGL